MGHHSFRLFARPSFVEGFARILDFGDTLTEYNYSVSGDAADREAITSDWEAIAADLKMAIKAYRGEQKQVATAKAN